MKPINSISLSRSMMVECSLVFVMPMDLFPQWTSL